MNILAAFGLLHYFMTVAFVTTCVLLIIIVLLQKGRGGGIGSAFGGSSQSAFGAKTGDVFTWITVALAAFYLLFAILGNYVFVPLGVATTAPPPEMRQSAPGPEPTSPQAPSPQTPTPNAPTPQPSSKQPEPASKRPASNPAP